MAEVTAGINTSSGKELGAILCLRKRAVTGTPKIKSRTSLAPPTPVNPVPITIS